MKPQKDLVTVVSDNWFLHEADQDLKHFDDMHGSIILSRIAAAVKTYCDRYFALPNVHKALLRSRSDYETALPNLLRSGDLEDIVEDFQSLLTNIEYNKIAMIAKDCMKKTAERLFSYDASIEAAKHKKIGIPPAGELATGKIGVSRRHTLLYTRTVEEARAALAMHDAKSYDMTRPLQDAPPFVSRMLDQGYIFANPMDGLLCAIGSNSREVFPKHGPTAVLVPFSMITTRSVVFLAQARSANMHVVLWIDEDPALSNVILAELEANAIIHFSQNGASTEWISGKPAIPRPRTLAQMLFAVR